MNETEFYAFWSYDQFPYLLGGKVIKFNEDQTKAEVVGYEHYWLRFSFILPAKRGAEFKRKIENLRQQYSEAQAQLKANFCSQSAAMLKEFAPPFSGQNEVENKIKIKQ